MSSDDDDDFVSYGNPLDPIDEDSLPRKKPITVEDQFAKDEHGRRRFHGAFTGGFSAGFYNSVGSLEGWKPTNFISSRSNRTQSKGQTIFDFMDDEDQGEHGICPMSIQVKPGFDNKSLNNTSKKRNRTPLNNEYLHHAPVIQQMLAPVRDTVGVKLLMKMGWKPGQGVGPRVTKREKKLQKLHEKNVKKVYGCSLPTNSNKSESESSESEFEIDLDDITFAPDDYQPYVVNPKQNTFGLGYQGMDRNPVLSSKKPELSVLTVAGKSIRGQAFGVSVFEDEDDDIYGTEDMSNYDFSLPSAGEKKKNEKKSDLYTDSNCIEGFHIAAKPRKPRERFPLPVIPADFVPLQSRKNRWDSMVKPTPKAKVSSASERTTILSDEIINVSNIPLPGETPVKPPEESKPSPSSLLSSSFKPFAFDPEKQARYEKFLMFKNLGLKDRISTLCPPTMTEWEKERERTEFEQSARMYQPLSDDLACKFTSASQPDDVHDLLTPVEKVINPELETLKNAVANKMFGAFTRKKYDWIPDKVLCKRFNVPEPFKNSLQNVAEKTSKENRKTSLFEFLKTSTINSETQMKTSTINNETQSRISPEKPSLTEESETSTNDQPQQEVNEENAKDSDEEEITKITDKIDLFKAIFLSSSDEEDETENDQLSQGETSQKDQHEYNFKESMKNKKEIRYSPARGIFANLDLESLKCKPSFSKNEPPETAVHNDTSNTPPEVTIPQVPEATFNEMLYGPKIPTYLLSKPVRKEPRSEHTGSKNSDDESPLVWVEKTKKNKKHKKHKKQKHKKHK